MPPKKVSPDALCPCGSGRKRRDCCCREEVDRPKSGEGSKSRPVSTKLVRMIAHLRQQFIEKLGREPSPEDLVTSNMLHGEILEHLMVEGMRKAGIDPSLIYAFEKTGMLITDDNILLVTDDDLDGWQAALKEYEENHKRHVGIITCYGFDDKTTTKMTATVLADQGNRVVKVRSWIASNILEDQRIAWEIRAFFEKHGVKTLSMSDGNIGCAHEEGLDFPQGEDCPFCPFWKGKRGNEAEP